MAADKKATFALDLEGNVKDKAEADASALEELRERVQGGEAAIKEMSATMRRLRGSTDEVKKAKEELKNKIQAERDKVSAATLALIKNGAALKSTKKDTKSLSDVIKSAGGPVAAIKEKFDRLRELLGSGGLAASVGIAAIGVAALAAAFVAVTAAAGAAVFSFGKWLLQTTDAARSANLSREAILGNAEQARNLGTQVDALAAKIPLSTDKINEFAISLSKSRLTGEQIVDTLNAVGQASAAAGDELGNTFKDIITRGQLVGRLQINPFELMNKGGPEFEDVAGALAKNLKVGIGQARAALFEGRVKLGDGAKAIRDAIEKRFGDINLRKMLSIEGIEDRLKKIARNLTSELQGPLESLLKSAGKLFDLFDDSTVTGAAIKELVTVFGTELFGAMEKSTPVAKNLLRGMVIGALEAGIVFLKLKNQIRETFKNNEALQSIDLMTFALKQGALAAHILGNTILLPLKGFANLMGAYTSIKSIDWSGLGSGIVEGLINGLKSMLGKLGDTALELADSIKSQFAGALRMHSPSKVFEDYGVNTVKGYQKGVEAQTDGASDSLAAMAEPPRPRGGRASGQTVNVTVAPVFNISGGEAAKVVRDPGFLAQLTKAVEDALVNAGIQPGHV